MSLDTGSVLTITHCVKGSTASFKLPNYEGALVEREAWVAEKTTTYLAELDILAS